MRKMKNIDHGTEINIVELIITRGNLWEHFISDEETCHPSLKFGVVRGFETEMGDIHIPSIEPHILSRAKGEELNHVMPAPGWMWSDAE